MYHLRFTPYDISGYTFDFLRVYDQYIVAKEDFADDGSPLLHYHVLIGTDYGIKSVRDAATAALKIPKGQPGKANKWYALIPDWLDPGYICKHNDIILSKGFTEKQIMEYVISGKQKYVKLTKDPQPSADGEAVVRSAAKRISVDKEVIADCIFYVENHKKENDGQCPDVDMIARAACKSVRTHGKGINPFKIREYVLAAMYDTGQEDFVVEKCLRLL